MTLKAWTKRRSRCRTSTTATIPYEAIDGADALVILTEWNSYRSLDLDRVKSLLKAPVFIDLRNIYRPAEMQAAGFQYSSLGRTA